MRLAWMLAGSLLLSLIVLPTSSASTCLEGTVTACVGSHREDVCRFSGVTASVEQVAAHAGGYECNGPEGVEADASADGDALLQAEWSDDASSCRVFVFAGGVHQALSGTPCPEPVVDLLALLS